MPSKASLQLAADERIIRFGNLRPALPAGWYVLQLDSGHYMATNEDESCQSCITVNRYHARRWVFQLSLANAEMEASHAPQS